MEPDVTRQIAPTIRGPHNEYDSNRLTTLAALTVSLAFQQPAQADVRTLRPVQTLPKPPNSPYEHFGIAMAIDGPNIIVLAIDEGTTSHRYAACSIGATAATVDGCTGERWSA